MSFREKCYVILKQWLTSFTDNLSVLQTCKKLISLSLVAFQLYGSTCSKTYSKFSHSGNNKTGLLVSHFVIFILYQIFSSDLYWALNQIWFRINSRNEEFLLQKDVFSFKYILLRNPSSHKSKRKKKFTLRSIETYYHLLLLIH